MARSRNPAQRIEHAGTDYLWRTTPDVLDQVLEVWPRDRAVTRLVCVLPLSRVIAPALVRQVIAVAIAHGYDPVRSRGALAIQLEPPRCGPLAE